MRGRPPFRPTKRQRDQVMWRKAANWSDAEIAAELGIDKETMTKHFEAELLTARSRKRGAAFDMLMKSAKKGNVSAQKKIFDLLDKRSSEEFDEKLKAKEAQDRAVVGQKPTSKYVGKKVVAEQQALAAASGSSSKWGNDLNVVPIKGPISGNA